MTRPAEATDRCEPGRASESPMDLDLDELDVDVGGLGQATEVAGAGSEAVISVAGQGDDGRVDGIGLAAAAEQLRRCRREESA